MLPSITILLFGALSGLSFAPLFFTPCLFLFSFLCYYIKVAKSLKSAAILGFLFGFGHFFTSMYWVSIGVSVYINEFWWAIPLTLIGLPAFLACFITISCIISWLGRNKEHYHILFCFSWMLLEWVRSWAFTGMPWNLLGYTLTFSNTIIQIVSVFSIYGLSFITIYSSTLFYDFLNKNLMYFKLTLIVILINFLIIITFGMYMLITNPTQYSNLKVRLIQPSIAQKIKWDKAELSNNFNKHILLSKKPNKPNIIIWPEAAVTVPYLYVKKDLIGILEGSDSLLITGGITESNDSTYDYKIYNSLYAINKYGEKIFEYNKSYLVPFGEYMPLKHILAFKKITNGFIDYTKGIKKLVYIKDINLKIKALICYESIFPDFVRVSNKDSDLIINVTNDAWYGRSFGPYQHFHISRMRAIENGLPMLRVANNGISAIIDPLGRVINSLKLNDVNIIDNYCPKKLNFCTIYSLIGDISALFAVIFIMIIKYIIKSANRF